MQAILRTEQLGHPAGTRVTCDATSTNVPDWVLVETGSALFHVQPTQLLPVVELFKRQPEDCFWVITRPHVVGGEWLTWPEDGQFGSLPFRFESEGEARVALAIAQQAGCSKFLIGQLKAI